MKKFAIMAVTTIDQANIMNPAALIGHYYESLALAHGL